MGTTFEIVNYTKKELISFSHLPVSKKKEICGNPVSSAIVSWYLINNRGDNIHFLSEFEVNTESEHFEYIDVTDQMILELVENGILKDNGMDWVDEDDPKNVYIRAIKNIWMDH